jgi:hypothetical protein
MELNEKTGRKMAVRREEREEDIVQKREVEGRYSTRGIIMGMSTIEKVMGRLNTSERTEGNHGVSKVIHRSNHMYELKHFGMVWQRRNRERCCVAHREPHF